MRTVDPDKLAASFAKLHKLSDADRAEVAKDLRDLKAIVPDLQSAVPFYTGSGALAYEVTRHGEAGGRISAARLDAVLGVAR
jgi:hypothetical protein